MYGDEVGVFDIENNLVGSAVYQQENLAVTVWGNDETNSKKDGLFQGEEYFIRLLHIANGEVEELFIENWLSGDEYYNTNDVAITGKILRPENSNIPYYLSQNYPNPFINTTTINYYLPEDTYVKIQIFNIFGELIDELISENQNAGNHSLTFNLKNYKQGTYFYSLTTAKFTQTKKMSIIK